MAGQGDEADALRAQAVELGVADRIEFPGRLPHERVVELLQSLDLAVTPSTCQESFGVAAIEASACELPVVATRVGGVSEAVLDGETGLLVPPGDPGALADACLELLADPERRQRMGQAGRRFVQSAYPWAAHAATMGVIYEQLLAGVPVQTPNMILAGRDAPALPARRGIAAIF